MLSASAEQDYYPLSLSRPAIASDNSTPIRDAQIGSKLVVTTTAENHHGGKDMAALFVVEVRDSQGITALLDWQNATIKEGDAMTIGISWIPDRAGDYELRAFAISDPDYDNGDAPAVLSAVSSSSVSIISLQGSRTAVVGNKTFEVRYELSSAGSVRNIRVDVQKISIVTTITGVQYDANLTLVLPRKMLEQLEKETHEHYCVGNGFVTFVNRSEVYGSLRDTDAEKVIITIPVRQGANRVEIIGTDILEAPATCLTAEQFKFAANLPVKVKSWYDAVEIARDYLDNLAQSNGEKKGAYSGGPIGGIKLVYVDSNGTAFEVNKHDGSYEDANPYFEFKSPDSYFWIVTLNYARDINTAEYIFTIDAQTGEVKRLIAS
jgi:hypothetical protein